MKKIQLGTTEPHAFEMSAIKEFCVCGEKKDHSRHTEDVPKPESKDTLLVGIDPDTPWSRDLVTSCLRWSFVSQEDEGLWLVDLQGAWPPNVDLELKLIAPRSALPAGAPEDGIEVLVTLEWP